jgi:peptidoglycan/LPS O-acetylase OafA/YrhL
MISNGKKLLASRDQNKEKKDTLELLNAVRVLSIGWVILGHTCLNYLDLTALSNINDAMSKLSDTEYIIVYGAFYAVDTFFWLSGFLMSYLFILEINKMKLITIPKILMVYLHRYLRITPVFIFCVMFFWTLQEHLGNGPLYFDIGIFMSDCKSYWYTNMIYLQNFIPDFKGNGCLGVGWYLAIDMQYFIFSPLLLICYMKFSKIIGWACIGILCVVGCVTSGIIAHHYDLSTVIFSPKNGLNYFNYYYS